MRCAVAAQAAAHAEWKWTPRCWCLILVPRVQEVEELCNDRARLCNRLRARLQGTELEAFNADVARMAVHLDALPLANVASGGRRDVSRPATAPDIDTLIVEATCRRGEPS